MKTHTSVLLLLVLRHAGIVAATHGVIAPVRNKKDAQIIHERDRAAAPVSFIWRLHNEAAVIANDEKQDKKTAKHVVLPQGDVDASSSKVPLLLVPWVSIYRAIPELHLPFTELDVAFTVLSALFLTCVDYASEYALVAIGWPAASKDTRAAAGSIATMVHSTCLVLGLGACLATQRYDPSGRMEAHPDWWQDGAHALIQFCTGYMLYDSVVQFVADRWQKGVGPVLSSSDLMFLGHHAATSLYMTSARLCEAGHMSAMILMFTGEFTAPIMNLFRLSRLASTLPDHIGDFHGRQFLHAVRPYAEYLFAVLYAFFRILVGPLCAAHLTYDILLTKRGRKNVPVGLSVVWLSMCWGVLLGSLPWIKNALGILRAGCCDPTTSGASVDP